MLFVSLAIKMMADDLNECNHKGVMMRFTKEQRLLKPDEFGRVFDDPTKKIHSTHFMLFVKTGQTQPRLGLAITKKKLKLAVVRNRLKRLTREHFRQNAPCLSAIDVVLIVKKGYPKHTDPNAELSQLFAQLTALYPCVRDDC